MIYPPNTNTENLNTTAAVEYAIQQHEGCTKEFLLEMYPKRNRHAITAAVGALVGNNAVRKDEDGKFWPTPEKDERSGSYPIRTRETKKAKIPISVVPKHATKVPSIETPKDASIPTVKWDDPPSAADRDLTPQEIRTIAINDALAAINEYTKGMFDGNYNLGRKNAFFAVAKLLEKP